MTSSKPMPLSNSMCNISQFNTAMYMCIVVDSFLYTFHDKVLFVCEPPIVFHQTGLPQPQRAILQKYFTVENRPTRRRKQEIADEMKVPYDIVHNWYKRERAGMNAASKSKGSIKCYMYI